MFLLAPSAIADTISEIDLGNGAILTVRDAGFVQVLYTDEAFGLTLEPRVSIRQGEDQASEASERAITDADLARACAIVLARPEARIGKHPPDYILFQTVKRRVDTGLFSLSRTKSVYFETRTDRCRVLRQAPEEVK
ncbi:MAG: hypothetical protein AAF415_06815 [Pseudomonadota bacterium]